jgi:hypothetical protein
MGELGRTISTKNIFRTMPGKLPKNTLQKASRIPIFRAKKWVQTQKVDPGWVSPSKRIY